jgi:hypothetical protein
VARLHTIDELCIAVRVFNDIACAGSIRDPFRDFGRRVRACAIVPHIFDCITS